MTHAHFSTKNVSFDAYSKDSTVFLKQSITKKVRLDCALCGGDDTLSVGPGHKHPVIAFCFKCRAPGNALLAALGIGPAPLSRSLLSPLPKQTSDTPDRRKQRLDRILSGCKRITRGSPPWLYLDHRGCLPDESEGIPPCLLYHPSLAYYDDGKLISRHPALVSKLEDIQHNLITLHLIYLTPDGCKASVPNPKPNPKKLMPPIIAGTAMRGAIQLDEPGNVLGIAEGLETSLWLRKQSIWPFWACYCASAMRQVQIPWGVREVLIFPDTNKVGRQAAKDAADRLVSERFKVVIMPPPASCDWDDIVQGSIVA
jgi:hypothetical protein